MRFVTCVNNKCQLFVLDISKFAQSLFLFVGLKFFVQTNLPDPLVTFTSSASTTIRPVNDQFSQIDMIDDNAHKLDDHGLFDCDTQVKKKPK